MNISASCLFAEYIFLVIENIFTRSRVVKIIGEKSQFFRREKNIFLASEMNISASYLFANTYYVLAKKQDAEMCLRKQTNTEKKRITGL